MLDAAPSAPTVTSTEWSKHKRKLRRAAARYDKKPPVVLPPPPMITYFLDAGLVKGEAAVMIRTKSTRQIGYGRKAREIIEYGKWRVFPNATRVCPTNDCTFLEYVGVTAPITAWAQVGLLERLIDRDTPRERNIRTRKRAA